VVVHDDDLDDALGVVEQFRQQALPPLTAIKEDSPSVQYPRTDGWLWVQLVTVLALTQPYYSPADSLLWRDLLDWSEPSFAREWVLHVGVDVLTIVIVLSVVRLTGERWSTYGLKPRNLSVDLITGCLAFVCGIGAAIVGSDLLKNLLIDLQDKPYVEPPEFRYWMEASRGVSGLFAMLALAIVVGLAEELVARGYLITTLERLLKSTPLAVLVAAVYFGVCHAPSGILSAWSAFLIGIVFGIFFVCTRRIFPLVFAHALIDFSVFIHRPQ
jgi:membrane protease YdiL (CAAX protease family)